jgi:hypothetical protein
VFFPVGGHIPAVGSKASGYRTSTPKGAAYRRSGAPATGGTVARAGGGQVDSKQRAPAGGPRPRVGSKGGGRR